MDNVLDRIRSTIGHIDSRITEILDFPFRHTDTYIGVEASINVLLEAKMVLLGLEVDPTTFDAARRKVNNNVKHALAEPLPGRKRPTPIEDLREFVDHFNDRLLRLLSVNE